MPSDKPKSSDDLIREAREQFNERPDVAAASVTEEADGATSRPAAVAYTRQAETALEDPRTSLDDELMALEQEAFQAPSRPVFPVGKLVLWAAIGAAAFGFWFFTTIDDAERSETGAIVEAGDLDVMSVEVGDCFDDPTETDVVFNLDAVPCTQPHDNEVFALTSVETIYSSFPGADELFEYSQEHCIGTPFSDYVGIDYLDSQLDVWTLTPTSESWAEGDREIVCVLYNLDLSKLTESARSSGI